MEDETVLGIHSVRGRTCVIVSSVISLLILAAEVAAGSQWPKYQSTAYRYRVRYAPGGVVDTTNVAQVSFVYTWNMRVDSSSSFSAEEPFLVRVTPNPKRLSARGWFDDLNPPSSGEPSLQTPTDVRSTRIGGKPALRFAMPTYDAEDYDVTYIARDTLMYTLVFSRPYPGTVDSSDSLITLYEGILRSFELVDGPGRAERPSAHPAPRR